MSASADRGIVLYCQFTVLQSSPSVGASFYSICISLCRLCLQFPEVKMFRFRKVLYYFVQKMERQRRDLPPQSPYTCHSFFWTQFPRQAPHEREKKSLWFFDMLPWVDPSRNWSHLGNRYCDHLSVDLILLHILNAIRYLQFLHWRVPQNEKHHYIAQCDLAEECIRLCVKW